MASSAERMNHARTAASSLLLEVVLLPGHHCQPRRSRLWIVDPWMVPPDPVGRPYPPITACAGDQLQFVWAAAAGRSHGLFKLFGRGEISIITHWLDISCKDQWDVLHALLRLCDL
jgi:hypothetical protein